MKYYSGIIKIATLIILMPLMLGKCTFSRTFQLYNKYRNIQALEEQLQHKASTNNPVSLPVASHDENLISNGRVIELINPACDENNIMIKQYEPALTDTEGDYKLYTANLILAGTYIELVKILQYCEENIQSAKISTLKFEYDEKKMKDKKIEMLLTFIQIEGLASCN